MSNNNIIAEIKAPRDSFKKEFCEDDIENDKTPKANKFGSNQPQLPNTRPDTCDPLIELNISVLIMYAKGAAIKTNPCTPKILGNPLRV